MPNPFTQDVDSTGTRLPQAIHRRDLTVCDRPAPTVHANGDDFSVVTGFNLLTDVALVHFPTKLSRLFARATCNRQGL